MSMLIISLYLKFNLILLLALLAWLGIKNLSQRAKCSLTRQKELLLLRLYFPLALLLPIFFSYFKLPFTNNATLQKMTVVGQNVSTGIDLSLSNELNIAGQYLSYLILVIILLILGISIQCYKNYREYRLLKTILNNSIQWKNICGVSISFSQAVSTPFSTKALGVKQIVLPYQLLESPRDFRLAVKHELQHIRNNDLTWVLLLDFIKPMFFWNPAYYAWHNEFHCLQEYACDEVLLTKTNINSTDYGSCLLTVASYSSNHSLFASSNMVPNFSLFTKPQSQLRRRILMMKKTHNAQFATLKLTFIATFLLISLFTISACVLAPQQESELIRPIETTPPNYPNRALQDGTEGWVLIEHSIDINGNVKAAKVISSCVNLPPTREEVFDKTFDTSSLDCSAGDIFNSSSIAAIEQFKFEPIMIDGKYAERSGVRYLFRYQLKL